MPAVAEVAGMILVVFVIVFVIALLVFKVYEGYNPNNTVSRRIEAFSNTPRIKAVRSSIAGFFNFCVKAFFTLTALWIGYACVDWYFNESKWWPREREVEVDFKANQWVDGEIKNCLSRKATTPQDPDAEIKTIFCSIDANEFHVFKVNFRGPIKADTDKMWKCERSQSGMTCTLQ